MSLRFLLVLLAALILAPLPILNAAETSNSLAIVDTASRATQNVVVVVGSSRRPAGDIERDGGKLSLHGKKARILLALALLQPRSATATQRLYYTY